MNDSKNDEAWELIFNKHKIIEKIINHGHFEIKSSDINKFREARLMTKFDYKSQLPKIFSQNNLSILPITRGSYIISDFSTFKDFEEADIEVKKIDFPNYIESIDINKITSEATALNCAFLTGIIDDFVCDEDMKPTVSGRMSSNFFDFKIQRPKSILEINVKNAQLEIDGGYEGVNSLNIVEAKNSISRDFNIRQLFYPFKLWKQKIKKTVRPIFLTYSNGIFHFREYVFEDPLFYNSINLVREKKYTISEGLINYEVIQEILNRSKIIKEPSIPFPQADSFTRIINLCELLFENNELTQNEITENYDFDFRQTDYYTNACRYLGLIEKFQENEVKYFLSKIGEDIFNLPIANRQKRFIELILSHLPFNKVLHLYFKKGEAPNKKEIVKIMKESDLFNVNSESTYFRRASTIARWTDWILDQIEE